MVSGSFVHGGSFAKEQNCSMVPDSFFFVSIVYIENLFDAVIFVFVCVGSP